MFDRKLLKKDGGPLLEDFLVERPDLIGELDPDGFGGEGSMSLTFLRPWLAWLDEHGHVEPAKIESMTAAFARQYPEAWAKAGRPPEPCAIILPLLGGMTDDDLLFRMRAMRRGRETGTVTRVVCLIGGYDRDGRAVWQIPEARAFCRRLVETGFISYLDATTAGDDPRAKPLGALEVWVFAENLYPGMGGMSTDELMARFDAALAAANAEADRRCGPIGGAA